MLDQKRLFHAGNRTIICSPLENLDCFMSILRWVSSHLVPISCLCWILCGCALRKIFIQVIFSMFRNRRYIKLLKIQYKFWWAVIALWALIKQLTSVKTSLKTSLQFLAKKQSEQLWVCCCFIILWSKKHTQKSLGLQSLICCWFPGHWQNPGLFATICSATELQHTCRSTQAPITSLLAQALQHSTETDSH